MLIPRPPLDNPPAKGGLGSPPPREPKRLLGTGLAIYGLTEVSPVFGSGTCPREGRDWRPFPKRLLVKSCDG